MRKITVLGLGFVAVAACMPIHGEVKSGSGEGAFLDNVVHRGWGLDWPHNALVSIRKCWKEGFVPEVDARLCKERKIFALHDLNGNYDLKNVPWSEIAALDVGVKRGRQWKGERPPLWEDIMTEMEGHPERKLLVDLKDATPEMIIEMAKRHGVERQLITLSSCSGTLKKWKRLLPGVETRYVVHPGNWSTRFLEGELAEKMRETVKKRFARVEADGFDGIDTVKFVVRVDPSRKDPFSLGREPLKDMFARVHAAGKKVGVWVWSGGKHKESYRLLREMGVDNFGTDYPETMQEFLKEERQASRNACAASSGRNFSHDIPGDGPKPWTHLNFQDDADDFHFAIVPDRSGGGCRGAFTNALAKVNLLRPAFVMTVGDLIEGLRPPKVIRPQQIELTNMTSKVVAPFFYVVGNHDIGRSRPEYPRNNEESLSVWKEFYGDRTYYSFMYRGVLFVVLNTMEGRDSRRPQRGITAEQYAWFKETLEKHSDARWTMVFMHQPYEWKTSQWMDFEKKVLNKRKYTVFAGDWHHYIYARRHGREYYILGVAGGFSASGATRHGGDYRKWHTLMGKEYGEMDHLTWVTMTKAGPVVANLTLDGILPGDYLTQRNTLSEEQLIPLDEPVDKVVVERFKKIKARNAKKKAANKAKK